MTLLYFSPVPWDSYRQRPHEMARHFLRRRGCTVIWIDPYPTRLPAPADLRRIFRRERLTTSRPAGLTVVGPGALPVEPLVAGRWATRLNRALLWTRLERRLPALDRRGPIVLGIGRPHSLALAALERTDRLARESSFYDAMDDFPEFFTGLAARAARRSEHAIASGVDRIFAASSGLTRKFDTLASKTTLVRNAFDMASLPPVAPRRTAGAPVLGYVGCVGAWFDWPVTIALARRFPSFRVRIVGPVHTRPKASLSIPSNIELLPACSHEDAIRHMQTFAAGLIPFARTPLTACVDPIKYYGYRGMGLPVLSTTFGDMATRAEEDGVFKLDADGDDGKVVERALASPVDASEIARFRDENSWTRRFGVTSCF